MKLKSFLALLFSALLFIGCSETEDVPDPDTTVEVTGISLSESSYSLEEGEDFTLTATLSPSGATGTITWASEDSSVATVSGGKVTAVAVGVTNITATCGDYTAACEVTVTEAYVEPDIDPTGISLDQTTYSLIVGKDFTLVATLEPEGAVGEITWATEDSAIATVDGGKVTGVAVGVTNITATCGEFSASCEVTVISDPDDPTSSAEISLSGSDYYLFMMDDTTYETIKDKVVADLRPDDTDTFVWNWNGYEDGTCEGTNAYGQDATWISRVVASGVDWSGLGFQSGVSGSGDYSHINALANVTDAPEEFYLHVAFKTSSPASHLFKFESDGLTVCLNVGNNGSLYDDKEYPVAYTYDADGEWHHLDIPVTAFTENGFKFSSSRAEATNTLIILSGSEAGITLDFDAAFFYKKN